MTTENNDAIASKKAGRIILFSMLAFFLVFASVDAFFIYKALTTNTGVVVENPYEVGLNYNEIIQKAKQAQHDDINEAPLPTDE